MSLLCLLVLRHWVVCLLVLSTVTPPSLPRRARCVCVCVCVFLVSFYFPFPLCCTFLIRYSRQLLMDKLQWRLSFVKEREKWLMTTKSLGDSNWCILYYYYVAEEHVASLLSLVFLRLGFLLLLVVCHRLRLPSTLMQMVLFMFLPRIRAQAKNSKVKPNSLTS